MIVKYVPIYTTYIVLYIYLIAILLIKLFCQTHFYEYVLIYRIVLKFKSKYYYFLLKLILILRMCEFIYR